MELVLNDVSTKTILKEVMLEIIEDTGLAIAIREGRQDAFVIEEEIMHVLNPDLPVNC